MVAKRVLIVDDERSMDGVETMLALHQVEPDSLYIVPVRHSLW